MSGLLLIVLFIIVIVFSYLFFAPFYFELNTTRGLCRFRFHHFASINLKIADASPVAVIKIVGWKKQIDLLAVKNSSKEKAGVKKMERRKVKSAIPWKKIKEVIASFKISKCNISIDFGEMQLNGILFPAFYLLSSKSGKNIRINFVDENDVILEIENNLARMSWAYISS